MYIHKNVNTNKLISSNVVNAGIYQQHKSQIQRKFEIKKIINSSARSIQNRQKTMLQPYRKKKLYLRPRTSTYDNCLRGLECCDIGKQSTYKIQVRQDCKSQ